MGSSLVSVKDVAAAAGCSPRVAAAVLNPGNSTIRVSEATQQRVLAMARQLGYRPNELAKAIATGKSRVLGAVMESHHAEHKAAILGGAIEAASDRGYVVKVLSFTIPNLPTGAIERCMEWRLAGLIGCTLSGDESNVLFQAAFQHGIPLVLADNAPDEDLVMRVVSNEIQGMRQLIGHLTGLGHREIAYLGGNPVSTVSKRRTASFRAVMSEFGLPVRESRVIESSWYEIPVIEAAIDVLMQGQLPTAVVCGGDPLAMLLVRKMRARGVKVPEQLSVTGYANFYLGLFQDPPLTTVSQSFEQLGRLAAEQLIDYLETPTNERPVTFKEQTLATSLIVRDSTAVPPAQRISLPTND